MILTLTRQHPTLGHNLSLGITHRHARTHTHTLSLHEVNKERNMLERLMCIWGQVW